MVEQVSVTKELKRPDGYAVRQVMTCRMSSESGSRGGRFCQSWVNAQKGAVVWQTTQFHSMRCSSKLSFVQFALQDLAPELPDDCSLLNTFWRSVIDERPQQTAPS